MCDYYYIKPILKCISQLMCHKPNISLVWPYMKFIGHILIHSIMCGYYYIKPITKCISQLKCREPNIYVELA